MTTSMEVNSRNGSAGRQGHRVILDFQMPRGRRSLGIFGKLRERGSRWLSARTREVGTAARSLARLLVGAVTMAVGLSVTLGLVSLIVWIIGLVQGVL